MSETDFYDLLQGKACALHELVTGDSFFPHAGCNLRGVDTLIDLATLHHVDGGIRFGSGVEEATAALAGMVVESHLPASFNLVGGEPFLVFADRGRP